MIRFGPRRRDRFPFSALLLAAAQGHLAAPKKGPPRPKRRPQGGFAMFLEWVAVGAILAAGAVLIGFPFGVAVGYAWRDAISRARRIRYLTERERRRAN
jgi:hypothetical protein